MMMILSNRCLNGFPDPSKFAAARLTHYSTMQHRPSDSSRHRQHLLLSGDAHQIPGAATKCSCSVCTSNIISRWVGYMYNYCSGRVRSRCSGLQNAAAYELGTGHAALAVPTNSTNTVTASITTYN